METKQELRDQISSQAHEIAQLKNQIATLNKVISEKDHDISSLKTKKATYENALEVLFGDFIHKKIKKMISNLDVKMDTDYGGHVDVQLTYAGHEIGQGDNGTINMNYDSLEE